MTATTHRRSTPLLYHEHGLIAVAIASRTTQRD
ncbi:hypothetical protein L917_13947 [Phytophthora nicotianae]|uniref:Uncharacterized protein n=1 Tax=Phytophthora nicotianae TaxID=4792 RepID=W2IGH3_PHYNI|nr:hypothetical protein L916_14164 [Phytophthora nicotianae]ETL86658.1 hypothetical protein L917_13947 [Phytophthora nicotianae]ETM39824.1 hypothetical protein L914_14072 [Phytophthora nicotianae]